MPAMSDADCASLEVENHALRAELAWLQAQGLAKAEYQALAEAYQHSQVRFRSVFEASPLGQKIIGPDLTIREANAAMAALLGLESPAQLLGRRILEFVHPDHQADWERLRAALWAHHLPYFTLETRLLGPTDTPLWCRVTSVLFAEQGQAWGFTTLEDISTRYQLQQEAQAAHQELALVNEELRVTNEELLAANSQLGQTNAELDTFVYAASHDLKAPIINLESLVQAVAEQQPVAGPSGEPVAPLLAMMQQAIARFRHTLDSLTELGALPAAVTRQAVDLAALVEDVRQDLLPLLTETQGQLVVDLAGSPRLSCSAKHLRSLVFNLVSNGLKYRHPDRLPVVRVRSQRTAGQLVLRVEDNGLGLDSQQQGQLFGLFRRLHSHVEGSGVGLYLVQKIVENAGGSIRVESEPGRGSTFIVALPG